MRLVVEKFVLFHRKQKAYIVCRKEEGTRLDGQDVYLHKNLDFATKFSTMDFAGVIQMELENQYDYWIVPVKITYTIKDENINERKTIN
jgi:hypothetical protein